MLTTKITAIMAAGIFLCDFAANPVLGALVTPQEGMVYSAHSPSIGGCPEMDWHVRVGPNHTLTGMVATDGMQRIWNLSGSYTPDHKFHLNGKETGGALRTGTVDGQVRPNGSLVLTMGNISGPSPCNNKTVYLPWFRDGNAYDPNAGAGGGGG